jgi:predicted phosphodiesterase
MKKYTIALIILIAFAVCSCLSVQGRQSGSEARGIVTQDYDLRFGVISDTHVGSGGISGPAYPLNQRLEKVLDWYNTQDVKALVINGDITDSGTQTHWNAFRNAWELHKGSLQLIAVAGNHDFKSVDYNAHASNFEAATGQKTNAHYVINGYHFIVLDTGEGNFTDTGAVSGAIATGRVDIPGGYDFSGVSQSVRDWARTRIDIAKADNPGKPIFVFLHYPLRNTNYATSSGYTSSFGNDPLTGFFKDDPEVVIFGGHTHRPNSDPRAIWQGGFTSVNVPSLFYNQLVPDHLGNSEDGISNTGRYKTWDFTGQGMVVAVKGSKVTIENYDFDFSEGPRPISGIERIPQTWEFDVTKPSEFPFTNAKRNEQKVVPVFDETQASDASLGGIIMNTITDTSVTIEFPQAKIPGENPGYEVVYSYRFDFINQQTKAVDRSARQWSDFMLTPRLQKPTYTQLIGGLKPGTDYELRIYAYSSFQAVSTQYLTQLFKTK